MSRRKVLAHREPNGKPQRTRPAELMSPTEARRLMDAARTGLKDPVWGTTLGWLHLSGKLTTTQFAAGKRWAEVAAEYSEACQGPKQPRSANLNSAGGEPSDPDSLQGAKEAKGHTRALHRYIGALEVIRRTGEAPARAVAATCERGSMPEGADSLNNLRRGLDALATWWAGDRK